MDKKRISLEDGNGGREMNSLLESFFKTFYRGSSWSNFANDSATFKLPNNDILCFTTDSYTVDPIEFEGGNIGHLAVCGTVNDLAVMGCDPLGLSLGLIIEEGFELEILDRIIKSINVISQKYNIPIVTGDTKVMPKGKLDKIVINTSGIGLAKSILDKKIEVSDKVIISGCIGEHGIALLSKRFDFESNIKSDCKVLLDEMIKIRDLVKLAKDPTRGGIASCLNEIANQNKIEIEIVEDDIPIKKEVKVGAKLLGLDVYSLANEGKIITICSKNNADKVLEELKKFNSSATIIGEVKDNSKSGKVILNTSIGKRILGIPSGKIVPRIC